MNTLQKLGLSSIAVLSLAQQSSASILFSSSGGAVQGGLQGSTDSADKVIQSWVSTALGFMALFAVIYGIYGGYMILSAAGDDGKVKKGKTVLTHAILGLIVIFLSYSIVKLLITSFFGTTTGGSGTV